MAKIVTFINEKGGVGKTSTCFNSAWELSLRNKKVLMIDMDGQKANLTFFTGVSTENIKTMADVFRNDTSISETIVSIKENLDIIPADFSLSNLGMECKVTKFKKSLAEVKENYDYIFIDVNPSPGWSHYLSLAVSDYSVIIMLPDIASLEGNKGIIETIEEIQESVNPELKIAGILFNKNNNRTVLSKQVADVASHMAAAMETSLFETSIRQSVSLSENVIAHIGITEYSAKSTGASDFVSFTDELERRVK